MIIDFTKAAAESGKFELMPKGTYSAVIDEAEPGTSDNDNPKVDFTFTLTGDKFKNRKAWFTLSLVPAALWKVIQVLNRIAPEIKTKGKVNINWRGFAGKPCRLLIGHRRWPKEGGELQDYVREILAPKSKPLSESEREKEENKIEKPGNNLEDPDLPKL